MANIASLFLALMYDFIPWITASNLLFHDFEKAFTGQIINPDDLIIKEQIGEGECQFHSYLVMAIDII